MAKADFWHFHKVRVRFNETDPQGLAHNSVQLVWFGIGLHEYYRALDFDRYEAGARDKAGLHVVKATVEYKAPIRQDEEVEIATRISRLGRTSVTFVYELYVDDNLVSTGEQVWVNTSTETHRPIPWSPDFLSAVRAREPALEEPQSAKA